MIEKSDLAPQPFKQMWKWFSNTAHAEYIGIIQFRDYMFQPKQINNAIYSELFLAVQVTSGLIKKIRK